MGAEVYDCQPQQEDAQKAMERAKTPQCREYLRKVACLNEVGMGSALWPLIALRFRATDLPCCPFLLVTQKKLLYPPEMHPERLASCVKRIPKALFAQAAAGAGDCQGLCGTPRI